jgi:hypothetical protein
VRTLPYTNARVFDLNHTSTNGWDTGGKQWSLKSMASPRLLRQPLPASSSLPNYVEEYEGVSGTHWAPMCPHTAYWQRTIASVGARLLGAGFDGVYLDQIAEAGGEPCFDPTHGHPVGQGGFWASGYRSLLHEVAAASAAAKKTSGPPFVAVESNAEAEMDSTGGYLTWLAFGAEDGHYTSNGFFINAFAAVNGGYFAGFGGTYGQAWEVLNYVPSPSHPAPPGNADGLAAKMAWQTLSGVAIGALFVFALMSPRVADSSFSATAANLVLLVSSSFARRFAVFVFVFFCSHFIPPLARHLQCKP